MADPKPYLESLYHEIEPGYYDRVFRRGRGPQWFWHQHRFRIVRELLPERCARVLDLGCGPGTFLGTLKPSSFGYGLGLDLALAQIDYAERTYGRPGLEFRALDVRAFAGGEPFDAVTSIEVIEHLPIAETQAFLGTIRAVLKPGGTLVLTTPNYRSLWPLLERAVSTLGPIDYTRQHINPFTRPRLESALAEAGFGSIRSQTFFVLSPFAAAISKGLAGAMLNAERAVLPRWGAELAVCARNQG